LVGRPPCNTLTLTLSRVREREPEVERSVKPLKL